MNLVFRIVVLAIAGVVIDIPWLLGTSAWSGQIIRTIQGSALELNPLPAAIVYLAIAYLATIPKTATDAFTMGLATYAIYDFTNLATLKNYDPRFAVADSIWGGILFTALYYVNQYI